MLKMIGYSILLLGHIETDFRKLFSEPCSYCSGFQSVLLASKRIRDQFPGYPWIHFCNDYLMFDVLLKIIAEQVQFAMCLFSVTVRLSN